MWWNGMHCSFNNLFTDQERKWQPHYRRTLHPTWSLNRLKRPASIGSTKLHPFENYFLDCTSKLQFSSRTASWTKAMLNKLWSVCQKQSVASVIHWSQPMLVATCVASVWLLRPIRSTSNTIWMIFCSFITRYKWRDQFFEAEMWWWWWWYIIVSFSISYRYSAVVFDRKLVVNAWIWMDIWRFILRVSIGWCMPHLGDQTFYSMKYSLDAKRRRTSSQFFKSENLFFFLWPKYFLFPSFCYSGLLLNSIMTSFKPNFIAHRAEKFVTIISNCATEGITKAQLFRALGLCLSQCPPPIDQRSSVLTGSWKTITTFTHVPEFIACVEPWTQYIAMNFEVNLFFKFHFKVWLEIEL